MNRGKPTQKHGDTREPTDEEKEAVRYTLDMWRWIHANRADNEKESLNNGSALKLMYIELNGNNLLRWCHLCDTFRCGVAYGEGIQKLCPIKEEGGCDSINYFMWAERPFENASVETRIIKICKDWLKRYGVTG